MELNSLHVITHISKAAGEENITGLNQMVAYYQADDCWDDAHKRVDGASNLS